MTIKPSHTYKSRQKHLHAYPHWLDLGLTLGIAHDSLIEAILTANHFYPPTHLVQRQLRRLCDDLDDLRVTLEGDCHWDVMADAVPVGMPKNPVYPRRVNIFKDKKALLDNG